ncbi:hypothetical protein [uncultured Cocleimonas sp.]|uniref:hypothetical protein n=1 Tax=uncultured Cocleimonas sp. TaxID=1051587 RepID=UPI00260B5259|nr:hypothetical protein [uncultured Cocleimonas sp.]
MHAFLISILLINRLFFIVMIIVTKVTLVTIAAPAYAKTTSAVAEFTQAELQQFKGHYSTKFGYLFIQAHKKYASVTVDGIFIRLIKKSKWSYLSTV